MPQERLNLNKRRLKELSALEEHPKVEFLYLRDNELTGWVGAPIMPQLKILDLGYNLVESLDFLSACPHLKQLYLNSNHISSFEGMPPMLDLEHFSVSQNPISSLAGLPDLPSLRVFCLCNTNITSFDLFPNLPKVEMMRWQGSPISEHPLFVHFLHHMTPLLRKVDGTVLTPDFLSDSDLAISLKVGVCLRRGFMPSIEANTVEDIELECDRFVMSLNHEASRHCRFSLESAAFEGTCEEGHTVEARYSLAEHRYDPSRVISTVHWHSLSSVNSDWVSISADDDSSPFLVLSADEAGTCVRATIRLFFAGEDEELLPDASFELFSSDIVPAMPYADHLVISGENVEGEVIKVEYDYIGGQEGESRVEWLRSDTIIGTGAEYQLTLADVGFVIRARVLAIRSDGLQGLQSEAACSLPVQPAIPHITELFVQGAFVERELLEGIGQYKGGHEGNSQFQWYRVHDDAGKQQFFKIPNATKKTYVPTPEDFNHQLVFQYTPVSNENIVGPPYSVITKSIGAGKPLIEQAYFSAPFLEGEGTRAVITYSGGLEGASRFEWFRSVEPYETEVEQLAYANKSGSLLSLLTQALTERDVEMWEPIVRESLHLPELVPTILDINRGIGVIITPVRSDGLCGTPYILLSEAVCEAAHPFVRNLTLVGEAMQGHELVAHYTYIGGLQGNSQRVWHRIKDDDIEEVARDTDSYAPLTEDLDYVLKFTFTPVRSDGIAGEPSSATSVPVVWAPPKYFDVKIVGQPLEGCTLKGTGFYFGGIEGKSVHEWIRINPDGHRMVVPSATSDCHVVCNADDGCTLVYSVKPIRSDGVEGERVFSEPIGPCVVGQPTIANASLSGDEIFDPTKQCKVSFDYSYFGGGTPQVKVDWSRVKYYNPSLVVDVAHFVEEDPEFLNVVEAIEGAPISHTVTPDDIGYVIHAVVSVTRTEDGAVGEPVHLSFGPIVGIEPVCTCSTFSMEVPTTNEHISFIPHWLYLADDPIIDRKTTYKWETVDPTGEMARVVGNGVTFTPTSDIVGADLRCTCRIYLESGLSGTVTAMAGQVVWGRPVVTKPVVWLSSDFTHLFASYEYEGATEGDTEFVWVRINETDGTRAIIEGSTGSKHQIVRSVDCHCAFIVTVTPKTEEGVLGDPLSSVPSSILRNEVLDGSCIDPGLPVYQGETRFRIDSMSFVGKDGKPALSFVENVSISVKVETDGEIDDLEYHWSAVRPDGKSVLVRCSSNTFVPKLEHIDSVLSVSVVAVKGGERTEPVSLTATSSVIPGKPSVALELEAPSVVVGRPVSLSTRYFGGLEGPSKITFCRVSPYEREVVRRVRRNIPSSVQKLLDAHEPVSEVPEQPDVTYRPTVNDHKSVIQVKYTPERIDGVKGAPVIVETEETVKFGPKLEEQIRSSLVSGEIEFDVVELPPDTTSLNTLPVDSPTTPRTLYVNVEKVKVRQHGSSKTVMKHTLGSGVIFELNTEEKFILLYFNEDFAVVKDRTADYKASAQDGTIRVGFTTPALIRNPEDHQAFMHLQTIVATLRAFNDVAQQIDPFTGDPLVEGSLVVAQEKKRLQKKLSKITLSTPNLRSSGSLPSLLHRSQSQTMEWLSSKQPKTRASTLAQDITFDPKADLDMPEVNTESMFSDTESEHEDA